MNNINIPKLFNVIQPNPFSMDALNDKSISKYFGFRDNANMIIKMRQSDDININIIFVNLRDNANTDTVHVCCNRITQNMNNVHSKRMKEMHRSHG